MPSTFECPRCKSRYNNFVISVWNESSKTETTTYQCKQCLNLFDIERFCPDDNAEGSAELILEM